MSVSRRELLSRIEFRGIDKIEECFDKGQTCAGILGHYGNWELLSATGLVIKRHPEAVIGLIYHPCAASSSTVCSSTCGRAWAECACPRKTY